MSSSSVMYSYAGQDLEKFFEGSSLQLVQDIRSHEGESSFSSWLKYTGYCVPQKYRVSKEGVYQGQVTEQSGGWVPFSLKHSFLKSRRPSHFVVQNHRGTTLVEFYRPFHVWCSSVRIRSVGGKLLGRVQQKFSLFRTRYELFAGSQKPFGIINAGFTKFWSFEVLDPSPGALSKKSIGKVEKKWGGTAREVFTSLDTFQVHWKSLSLPQKIVLFCTAISIDMDHFEDYHH